MAFEFYQPEHCGSYQMFCRMNQKKCPVNQTLWISTNVLWIMSTRVPWIIFSVLYDYINKCPVIKTNVFSLILFNHSLLDTQVFRNARKNPSKYIKNKNKLCNLISIWLPANLSVKTQDWLLFNNLHKIQNVDFSVKL